MGKLDNIETQITEALSLFAKKALAAGLSDGKWTKGMMKVLGILGKKNRCDISVSSISDDYDSEWLFDMTWWKYDNGSLKEVPLVVESEWLPGRDDIQYDFEKLVVAKADHRLMIFQAATDDIRDRIDYLIEIVKGFKLSANGDRYLFAAYDWDEGEFVFKGYVKE